MPDFIQIQLSNPGAEPNGTDLIVVQKADGTPAGYTLAELAAYTSGVSFPQWQTDSANGALVTLGISTSSTVAVPDGVIPYNTVVRDTGFLTSEGVFTIPANVVKVEVKAGIHSTGTTPRLSIIKNDVTTNPIAVAQGSGGYATVISPEIVVAAGDTLKISCTGVTNANQKSQSFFSIRVTERVVA